MQFEDGKLTVFDKSTAMFLAFSHGNADSNKYIAVKNSLPHIKGLMRSRKRAEFAYDLVHEMQKNGLRIERAEPEADYKIENK